MSKISRRIERREFEALRSQALVKRETGHVVPEKAELVFRAIKSLGKPGGEQERMG